MASATSQPATSMRIAQILATSKVPKKRTPKSSDSPMLPCTFPGCDYETSKGSHLARHMHVHTRDGPRFRCQFNGCQYEAHQKSNLDAHILIHLRVKPYVCQVDGCAFKSAHPGSLSRHLKIANCPTKERTRKKTPKSDKKFVCHFEGCDYESTYKYKREAHVRTHGAIELRLHVCQVHSCNYASYQAGDLEHHMSRDHPAFGRKTALSPSVESTHATSSNGGTSNELDESASTDSADFQMSDASQSCSVLLDHAEVESSDDSMSLCDELESEDERD